MSLGASQRRVPCVRDDPREWLIAKAGGGTWYCLQRLSRPCRDVQEGGDGNGRRNVINDKPCGTGSVSHCRHFVVTQGVVSAATCFRVSGRVRLGDELRSGSLGRCATSSDGARHRLSGSCCGALRGDVGCCRRGRTLRGEEGSVLAATSCGQVRWDDVRCLWMEHANRLGGSCCGALRGDARCCRHGRILRGEEESVSAAMGCGWVTLRRRVRTFG